MTEPAPETLKRKQTSARFWIIWMWAFTVACGVASLDTAYRMLADSAAQRALLLLPKEDAGDAGRKLALEELRKAAPSLRAVQWISPRELAQQASRGLTSSALNELFSGEDAWLPWIVELKFQNPIGDRAKIQAWIDSLKANPQWRLVLWDAATISRIDGLLQTLQLTASAALLVIFLLGIVAIRLGPVSRRGAWTERGIGIAGAFVLILLFGASAMAAGAPMDERTWGVALAISFALAGLFAPMLKIRRSFDHPTPTGRAEEPHA